MPAGLGADSDQQLRRGDDLGGESLRPKAADQREADGAGSGRVPGRRGNLYSDDRPGAWDAPESGCYDPRWTLPIAWLFFFRPEDVRLIDVQYGGSQWQEVRMSSETSTALELIERRKPLPMSIVGHRIVDDVVARCVSKVGGGRGQYLMVDPSGVLGGINRDFEDDRGHAGRIARILAVLGDGSCPAEVARETTWP